MAVIFVLSFGAFRVLSHFSLYSSDRRSAAERGRAATASVVDRSTGASQALKAKHKAAAAAAAHKPERPPAVAARGQQQRQQHATAVVAVDGDDDAAATAVGSAAGSPLPADAAPESQQPPAEAAAAPLAGSSLQGLPGLPQPSPLDAGFSRPEAPWAGRDLGTLSLPPLQRLQDGTLRMGPLAPMQVERPAHAVDPEEAEALPPDASIPSMRERASMAVRASSAATEAAQRATAFSAAASSAATRAAEAAERAAEASAAVQTALERAAEDAMAAAVARMNKAVEMVADAESRAASAAALATAHQDIAEGQAAIAATAAALPQQPMAAARRGGGGGAVHAHLFSVWAIVADWAAGAGEAVMAALQRAVAWLAALWARLAVF